LKTMKTAIIGAGAAGLVMARHLVGPGSDKCVKFLPTIFEMDDRLGGTWIYKDQTEHDSNGDKIHSSMYKSLRTNLPKEVMAFPDFPFAENTEKRSFIKHRDVLEYLDQYCLHFGLEKYIRFSTIIESVCPVIQDDGVERWNVVSKNSKDHLLIKSEVYDAVVICSGHFSDPYVPDIDGAQSFKGKIDHSHNYRQNTIFDNKNVAFLGAHSSGMDIALEASQVAKKVYLCTRYPEKIRAPLPKNVMVCCSIVKLNEDQMVLMDDSEHQIDFLMHCTGYNYYYPFLEDNTKVEVTPFRVHPLYKHVLSIHHPTLAFLGLCTLVCPFPQFHQQAAFVKKCFDGTFELPSKDDMLIDEVVDLRLRTEKLGWPERHAHRMNVLQWDYNDDLSSLAGFPPLPPVYKKLYEHVWQRRAADVLGYRNDNFKVTGPNSFDVLNDSSVSLGA